MARFFEVGFEVISDCKFDTDGNRVSRLDRFFLLGCFTIKGRNIEIRFTELVKILEPFILSTRGRDFTAESFSNLDEMLRVILSQHSPGSRVLFA